MPTRGQSKKKTPPRVFFFCCGPGERQGKEKPRGRRHGARAKKKTPPRVSFFFCSGPGERQGKEKPRADTGPEQKKKHHPGCFFFAAAPAKGKGRRSPVGRRHGARATPPRVFFFFFAPAPGKGRGRRSPVGRRHGANFFLLWPRAGAQRGFSFPCLSPGPEQKKTLGGVFFCSGPVPAPNGASPSLPFAGAAAKKKKNTLGGVFFLLWPRAGTGLLLACLSPGPEQKKKTPWVVFFFFAAAPRGRSLTHCGPGWRCLPLAGVVFSFCCGPARTGVVFFFCCGPARTLTHSLWAGAISARPGWCFFFLLRPRRVFLDNSKKCLGYYIGSKKTRRGHSKKKTPLPTLGSFFGKPSNRCRTILGTQKGTLILTTTHPEMRFRVSARALARRQARLDEAPV